MNWDYIEYKPKDSLQEYIDCIWKEGYFNDVANQNRQHFIYPDLSIELIFTTADIVRNNTVKGSLDIQKSQLSGLKTGMQSLSTVKSASLAVRIKPEALYLFVDLPINEITDYTLEANLVFGDKINELESKLFENISDSQKVESVNTFFESLYTKNSHKRDLIFEKIVSQIRLSQGCATISELAMNSGLSMKSIERKFKNNLGLSPKKFSRLIRVVSALRSKTNAKNLTDLAYNHQFYDQMHFVREVKYFTGLTPSKFFNTHKGIQTPTLT